MIVLTGPVLQTFSAYWQIILQLWTSHNTILFNLGVQEKDHLVGKHKNFCPDINLATPLPFIHQYITLDNHFN